ncbi:MAG: hypothetical protein ATN36_04020 [Epulopiscium sp. Nele67-Bin005]|nr:MAG: hypothetical protein ATN36_04020 [Epulopiscium sp. Nele67-Bin005]
MRLAKKIFYSLVMVGTLFGAEAAYEVEALAFTQTSQQTKSFLTNSGVVQSPYVISTTADSAYLSRDGSKAELIQSGAEITLPGTYYLTETTNGQTSVRQFEILGTYKTSWEISDISEMEEILKMSFENFIPSVTFELPTKYYDIDELNDEIFEIIDDLMMTYPLLAFEGYQLKATLGTKTQVELIMNYPSSGQLTQYHILAENLHSQLVNSLFDSSMTNYEREFAVYNYIIDNVKYDKTALSYSKVDGIRHTLFGALVDKEAVCDGYSKLFMHLCNSVGVPTTLLTGVADGTPHAWNQVEIDGKTYHVDVTWADQDENQIGTYRDYFNEPDYIMRKTHTWELEDATFAQSTEAHLLNLNLPINNLFYVNDLLQLESVAKEMLTFNISELSIVLEGNVKNFPDLALKTLADNLQLGINYQVVEKTDFTILNVKKAN